MVLSPLGVVDAADELLFRADYLVDNCVERGFIDEFEEVVIDEALVREYHGRLLDFFLESSAICHSCYSFLYAIRCGARYGFAASGTNVHKKVLRTTLFRGIYSRNSYLCITYLNCCRNNGVIVIIYCKHNSW